MIFSETRDPLSDHALTPLRQQLLERNRVVVSLVARGVKQRDRPLAQMLAQFFGGAVRGLARKLMGIVEDEGVPGARVRVHAAAQRVARRNVLEPDVDARL